MPTDAPLRDRSAIDLGGPQPETLGAHRGHLGPIPQLVAHVVARRPLDLLPLGAVSAVLGAVEGHLMGATLTATDGSYPLGAKGAVLGVAQGLTGWALSAPCVCVVGVPLVAP